MVRLMNKWNMELLLLQTLFFHQGHSDDSVYCAWKEDGVCRGKYLGFKVKGSWLFTLLIGCGISVTIEALQFFS